MSSQFDEKGKIFTYVISKMPVMVTIQTVTQKIHGEIYVKRDERIKDELDQTEHFLAVTNAVILSSEDQVLYQTKFLVVNLEHIVWILPDDEVLPD